MLYCDDSLRKETMHQSCNNPVWYTSLVSQSAGPAENECNGTIEATVETEPLNQIKQFFVSDIQNGLLNTGILWSPLLMSIYVQKSGERWEKKKKRKALKHLEFRNGPRYLTHPKNGSWNYVNPTNISTKLWSLISVQCFK